MVEKAAQILDYEFSDASLLDRALTHASCTDNRLDSNERMEFLGDAILGYVVCQYLFDNFPEHLEGELTKIKSSVVSRKTCAQVTKKIKLHSMLNLGKGMSSRTGLPSSVSAAVLESIIAAIYMDGGMEPATAFILRHFVPLIEIAAESQHQHNFKSVLQQYAQRNLPCNPIYVLLDEKGPDHAKCFEVTADVNGQRFGSAWAQSKKEAEQRAALNALIELDIATEDENGHVLIRDDQTIAKAKQDDELDILEDLVIDEGDESTGSNRITLRSLLWFLINGTASIETVRIVCDPANFEFMLL